MPAIIQRINKCGKGLNKHLKLLNEYPVSQITFLKQEGKCIPKVFR